MPENKNNKYNHRNHYNHHNDSYHDDYNDNYNDSYNDDTDISSHSRPQPKKGAVPQRQPQKRASSAPQQHTTSQNPFPNADYGDYFNEEEQQYRNAKRTPSHYSEAPKPRPDKKKKKKKKTKGKAVKIIISVLLVLVFILCAYTALIVFRINYSRENPDEDSVVNEVGELKSSSNVQNILLFGADNHAEDEYGRSDSVILLSIDKEHKILKQTSFLRDLYVTIPGYGEDRLNAAFAYGGARLATETIEYNFRIKIDSYALVDFSSFTSIIDAMGGIDLNLTAEEIDYINWQSHRNHQVDTRNELDIDSYDFRENDNGDETAVVHLNGRQALWYARDRDSEGSDFDRTSRQRIVINTIFSTLKSKGPITFMHVIYQIAPLITTNMSYSDVLRTGLSLFGYLRYDRKEHRVPLGDNFSNTWIGESVVLTIDDPDYEIESLHSFVFDYSGDE